MYSGVWPNAGRARGRTSASRPALRTEKRGRMDVNLMKPPEERMHAGRAGDTIIIAGGGEGFKTGGARRRPRLEVTGLLYFVNERDSREILKYFA